MNKTYLKKRISLRFPMTTLNCTSNTKQNLTNLDFHVFFNEKIDPQGT